MFKSTLRRNILLSLGGTISAVLLVSTYFQISNLKSFALETVGIRSEALAQGILNNAEALKRYNPAFAGDPQSLLEKLSVQCSQLYELNRDKSVTHFAVVNPEGFYAAHSTTDMGGKTAGSTILLSLKGKKLATVLYNGVYHSLVPILDGDKFIGAVDVGMPESYASAVVNRMVINSLFLLILFLAVSLSAGAYLTQVTIKKPIDRIISLGRDLARGKITGTMEKESNVGKIAALEGVFNDISAYLTYVAGIASEVPDGVLDSDIVLRSEHDILGKSVQSMLEYLKRVASVAAEVANGNLAGHVETRSEKDAFGKSLESMKKGLSSLIFQVRSNAQGIMDMGREISELSGQGESIVREVNAATEEMTTTKQVMGESIQSVASNMENLSSSAGETTASMTQMTSSISHITVNAEKLSQQANRTIEALTSTVRSIEKAADSVSLSSSISQETTLAATEGRESMDKVMEGMEMLHGSVTAAASTMVKFEERSRDIGTILEVIQEIADSTSLLALNAAIIAAQAGEKGRGFGVVAEEIKKLAEGVKSSSQEIGGIVNSLQMDISSTVATIRQGSELAGENMDRTRQARESLEKISESAEQSSREVTDIANALHELKSTSRSVMEAMESVKNMSDDITSAATQQQASTAEIMTAMGHVDKMSHQIANATEQQATGIRNIINITSGVSKLMGDNLSSSESIVESSKKFISQAEFLIGSVRLFQLNGGEETLEEADGDEEQEGTVKVEEGELKKKSINAFTRQKPKL
ncbi:MAG: methyl-accepting chemotaxis protein [bacterium]|nr:methyl-accepting chemotaxis protein [bacterium]